MTRKKQREFDVNSLSLSYNCIPKGLWQLSSSAVTLYLIILDFQTPVRKNDELIFDGCCTLTNKEIKKYTGLGDRMIQTGINDLIEAGLLTCSDLDGRRTLEIDHTPFRDLQHEMEVKANSWGWNHSTVRRGLRGQYPPSSLYEEEFVSTLTDEQIVTAFKNIAYRRESVPEALAAERAARGLDQRVTPGCTPIGDSARVHQYKKALNNETSPEGESCSELGEGSLGELLVSRQQESSPQETSPADSTEGGRQSDLENLPTELGVKGSSLPQTKAERKRQTGAAKFEEGPEHASVRNMIDYFGKIFHEKYGTQPVIVLKPQDFAILKRGFYEKYPREKLKPILDSFVKDYEKLPIDHEKYPRPTLRALTQAWLIDLVLNLQETEVKQEEAKQEVAASIDKAENFRRLNVLAKPGFNAILNSLSIRELDKIDKMTETGEIFKRPWFNTEDPAMLDIIKEELNE